jgi:hypothetical protein
MKKILFGVVAVALTALSSCEEENTLPQNEIIYINLSDRAVAYNQSQTIDLDNEGQPELSFSVILAQENGTNQLQYRVYALRSNKVFEVAGRALKMAEGQMIEPGNPFDKNVAPLVSRIESNGAITWQGDWLDANRGFLGFQFQLSDGLTRYGWVRMSFDRATEKLILHDVAYRQQAQVGIAAGQLKTR